VGSIANYATIVDVRVVIHYSFWKRELLSLNIVALCVKSWPVTIITITDCIQRLSRDSWHMKLFPLITNN
jgi:hypothetical protein